MDRPQTVKFADADHVTPIQKPILRSIVVAPLPSHKQIVLAKTAEMRLAGESDVASLHFRQPLSLSQDGVRPYDMAGARRQTLATANCSILIMAANLTPQYLKAEEQYRRAATTEEEIQWLEVMLREMPKHKASEKLQSELKQKLSRAKKELESERKSGKKSHGVRIPRQGAGTVVLVGGPNAGKSQLVRRLTRATPEVAPYPFTTRTPQPAMMPWEDVLVQLVDAPPITQDFIEPHMLGLIRGADVALLVVDVGNDEGIESAQELLERLASGKTRLARTTFLDEDDIGVSYTKTLLVANKCDLPEADERLALLLELCPLDFDLHKVSSEQGTGIEELRTAIFQALDVVRVYSKVPTAKEADFEKPFTLRRGGTVAEMAEQVHRDFVEKLKYARVWGSGVHDGTTVKGDHVLGDRDIVELHV